MSNLVFCITAADVVSPQRPVVNVDKLRCLICCLLMELMKEARDQSHWARRRLYRHCLLQHKSSRCWFAVLSPACYVHTEHLCVISFQTGLSAGKFACSRIFTGKQLLGLPIRVRALVHISITGHCSFYGSIFQCVSTSCNKL